MDFDDSKGSTPLTKTPSTDVWHHPCICDVIYERIFVSVNETTSDVGLKKMLTKLKDEYRTLIDLSYFQGFTHDEIAKMLGIPLGTVKTRIRTALSQLRIMIQ